MADAPNPETGASNGSVTISDSVVAKVAHNACHEIEGVHALGGAASRALSSLRGESRTQGVSVDIIDDTVDIGRRSLPGRHPQPGGGHHGPQGPRRERACQRRLLPGRQR